MKSALQELCGASIFERRVAQVIENYSFFSKTNALLNDTSELL